MLREDAVLKRLIFDGNIKIVWEGQEKHTHRAHFVNIMGERITQVSFLRVGFRERATPNSVTSHTKEREIDYTRHSHKLFTQLNIFCQNTITALLLTANLIKHIKATPIL